MSAKASESREIPSASVQLVISLVLKTISLEKKIPSCKSKDGRREKNGQLPKSTMCQVVYSSNPTEASQNPVRLIFFLSTFSGKTAA